MSSLAAPSVGGGGASVAGASPTDGSVVAGATIVAWAEGVGDSVEAVLGRSVAFGEHLKVEIVFFIDIAFLPYVGSVILLLNQNVSSANSFGSPKDKPTRSAQKTSFSLNISFP